MRNKGSKSGVGLEAGFTLLEVIIALGILVVIVAAVSVLMRNTFDIKFWQLS